MSGARPTCDERLEATLTAEIGQPGVQQIRAQASGKIVRLCDGEIGNIDVG